MSADFRRILCPVDLSGSSLDPLKLAVKIAEAVTHTSADFFRSFSISARTDPPLFPFLRNHSSPTQQALENSRHEDC